VLEKIKNNTLTVTTQTLYSMAALWPATFTGFHVLKTLWYCSNLSSWFSQQQTFSLYWLPVHRWTAL